jgi:aryl-alcohol dehydrogenase-like predicted oxidoreductase
MGKINKLALGTAQFGLDYGISNHDGQTTIGEVKSILDYAKGNGINTLDTASAYGNSEQVLGETGVNNYQIITKTTPLKNGVGEVIKDFHRSLDNLNVEQVDGLLIHNIDDTKDKQFSILLDRLNKLKKEGLIKKIGFSVYMPEQVDFLLDTFDFDLIQVPFNVFDDRLTRGGQLRALKNRGIEVHARSVFLQGVLLDFNNLSDYFLTWEGQFNEYQAMVKKNGLSLLEYALNSVLNIKEIDKVLVGVNSEKQLREIVQAARCSSNLDTYPVNDINLLNPSLWKV